MSRTRDPEFRGKICEQVGRSRPIAQVRLFLTRKLDFLYFPVIAVILQSASASVIAEAAPRLFRAAPAGCAVMFDLPELDGALRALAAEGGRPVLVRFFATWCEPCKAELSSLRWFREQRADQIGVLAVNVGEVPGRVRRFLEDTPVNFPVFDKNLNPKLAVTGDLDWTNADVGAEIDRALASTPNPRDAICTGEARR